jgi:hypothetical protein
MSLTLANIQHVSAGRFKHNLYANLDMMVTAYHIVINVPGTYCNMHFSTFMFLILKSPFELYCEQLNFRKNTCLSDSAHLSRCYDCSMCSAQ